MKTFISFIFCLLSLTASAQFRTTNAIFPTTTTLIGTDFFLIGRAGVTNFNMNASNVVQELVDVNGSTLLVTNLEALNIYGDGGGLTNVPGAFTNYTATAFRINTNLIYITGSQTNGINTAPFYWNTLGGTYTNANGFGFDYQYDAAKPYITNAVPDYIHQVVNDNNYTVWDEQIPGAGTPTGTWTNETFATTGSRLPTSYLTDYPYGVSGTLGLFGTAITNNYGTDFTPGSALLNSLTYPSFVGSSDSIRFSGPYHSIFSSSRIIQIGQRTFTAASGLMDIACTNADLVVLGCELGKIRNGQGVAAFIASSSFEDWSPSGTYTVIGSSGFTNTYMHFASLLGTVPPEGGGSTSLNYMDSSVGLNSGGSTNYIYNSIVGGHWQVNSNLNRSIVLGRNMRTHNATNNYLLGDGLASTSNNVVKIGFTGWHVLIQTNKLQLISNNVPYNVVLAP